MKLSVCLVGNEAVKLTREGSSIASEGDKRPVSLVISFDHDDGIAMGQAMVRRPTGRECDGVAWRVPFYVTSKGGSVKSY